MTSAAALVFALALLGADAASALSALETRLAANPENLTLGSEYRQLAIAGGAYDRAIDFLENLSERPNAGPHLYLNLALSYVDKIPTVGAFRRVSIGNKATKAATRSIELEPSDSAYLVRGLVNLYFEKSFFHRTPQGVADLEEARRLSASHRRLPHVARIYVALGDGYWRLKNRAKAREAWREGEALFPGNAQLRVRLTSSDEVVKDVIDKALDAGARVDTNLKDALQD
jgi:predicted Zn-dependent protease